MKPDWLLGDIAAFTEAQWQRFARVECDCPPECWHAEECRTTPIYAELIEELGSVWGWTNDFRIAYCFREWQFQQWWEAT